MKISTVIIIADRENSTYRDPDRDEFRLNNQCVCVCVCESWKKKRGGKKEYGRKGLRVTKIIS